MAESKLAEALDRLGTQSTGRGWEQLGFLRNPFPTRSSPIWDVFHNQDSVRDQFYADLVTFLQPPNPVTTMFFTGGNRVGKTHFMEYHRRVLPKELDQHRLVLPIAVVSAESASFAQFYFDVIEQLAESLRQQTGSPLIDQPIENLGVLPIGDFRRAMERLLAAAEAERPIIRTLFTTWLRGERHRQTQRHQLGVDGLVDSPSQMQNALAGLIAYLRAREYRDVWDDEMKRTPGVLIFVDEFEVVWQQRRDKRDQFLQGLRALIDMNGAGGGLFLVIGMATGLGPEIDDVEGDYPALFARLKGSRGVPTLVEIESALEGIDYARAFETFARAEFIAKYPDRQSLPPSEILGDREIERLFRDMLGPAPGATVTQADFFDRLHVAAEERRKQSSR